MFSWKGFIFSRNEIQEYKFFYAIEINPANYSGSEDCWQREPSLWWCRLITTSKRFVTKTFLCFDHELDSNGCSVWCFSLWIAISCIHFSFYLIIRPKSDYCLVLSITPPITLLGSTWLMWPLRVKILELSLIVSCRGCLCSERNFQQLCRNKTKAMEVCKRHFITICCKSC